MQLIEAIQLFGSLPDSMLRHYNARPLVSESQDLLDRCRNSYQARAAWLCHLIFNYDSDPPKQLSEPGWRNYEILAIADKAHLDLCRATRPKSPILKDLGFSTSRLWLLCKSSEFLDLANSSNLGQCLRISELPGSKTFKGKDESYQDWLSQSELRESVVSPTATVGVDDLGYFSFLPIVEQEARKIAYHDPKFEDLTWNPYWKIINGVCNQIRKNSELQATFLFKDGTSWNLYEGAKNKKLPSVKDASTKRGRGRPRKSNH